jgi:hypothetical protein
VRYVRWSLSSLHLLYLFLTGFTAFVSIIFFSFFSLSSQLLTLSSPPTCQLFHLLPLANFSLTDIAVSAGQICRKSSAVLLHVALAPSFSTPATVTTVVRNMAEITVSDSDVVNYLFYSMNNFNLHLSNLF